MPGRAFLLFLSAYRIPLLFAGVKLLAHLLTNTLYGFHRDEYLYLELGRHLGWGYMEVPPMIAVLAAAINGAGGELWLVRLVPALAGSLMIFAIGWQVKRLGGGSWAQIFACLAFLLAPAFLRSNTLFQPVTFNQFFWFAVCLLVVELIRSRDRRLWYALGGVAGLGLLTKYSIAFLFFGLVTALLLSPERKWWATRYPYLALGIASLLFLPNLLWQIEHNLPVVNHMQELARTQLVNVEPLGFLTGQFLMQFAGSLVAFGGLAFLLFFGKVKKFRPLGVAALLTIGIIAVLGGKMYYTLGVYPILYVFGGLAWERWLSPLAGRMALAAVLLIGDLAILPYSLPVLPLDQMKGYCAYMKDNFGLSGPLVWEDGRLHDLPQDYADMFGWEEMVAKLARFYHGLPEEARKGLLIQGGSYGHAGAINHFREKYDLPEAVSFSSSFVIWVPEDIPDFRRHILVDDRKNPQSTYFNSVVLVDSVSHPDARDPGYIYYRTDPKVDLPGAWKELTREQKSQFNF